MLDAKSGAYLLPSEPSADDGGRTIDAETIARGLGIVRRQIFLVLAFAVLGVALGHCLCPEVAAKYTATVTLLADTRKMELSPAAYGL